MVEYMIAILAFFVVLLSGMMIFARNPINSAFCLVILMVCLGGIYAAIGAHFVAALQIVVYAGAVMVLVIFSIMLMNLNEERGGANISIRTLLPLGVVLCFFVFFAVAFVEWQFVGGKIPKDEFSLDVVKQLGGNVFSLSIMMFSKAYLAFELVGLLLPIAVTGALVLAKRKVD